MDPLRVLVTQGPLFIVVVLQLALSGADRHFTRCRRRLQVVKGSWRVSSWCRRRLRFKESHGREAKKNGRGARFFFGMKKPPAMFWDSPWLRWNFCSISDEQKFHRSQGRTTLLSGTTPNPECTEASDSIWISMYVFICMLSFSPWAVAVMRAGSSLHCYWTSVDCYRPPRQRKVWWSFDNYSTFLGGVVAVLDLRGSRNVWRIASSAHARIRTTRQRNKKTQKT